MRIILCLAFLLCLMDSHAQAGYYYSDYTGYSDYDYNESDFELKYPYAKRNTPQFFGLVAGYNVLKAKEIEAGLVMNFFEGPNVFGMTAGYQLLYRRSLEYDRNAVDLDMGIYGLVSMGIGVNYNFSRDVSAVGFKPFIGTSIYHFQLLYGYNFLRKEKKEWFQLSSHSLSLRYLIPLKAAKRTYYYLPPAPTYNNLPGLHKNHPLKKEEYPRGKGYRY